MKLLGDQLQLDLVDLYFIVQKHFWFCLVANSCPVLCTPWAVVFQAPLTNGFSRQEYWSGCHSLLQGDLPDAGIKPEYPSSPALIGGWILYCWASREA